MVCVWLPKTHCANCASGVPLMMSTAVPRADACLQREHGTLSTSPDMLAETDQHCSICQPLISCQLARVGLQKGPHQGQLPERHQCRAACLKCSLWKCRAPMWCCKTVVPCLYRTKQTEILSHASSQREALEGRVYEQEVALEHRFDELEAAVQVGGCYVARPASSPLHGLTMQVLEAVVPWGIMFTVFVNSVTRLLCRWRCCCAWPPHALAVHWWMSSAARLLWRQMADALHAASFRLHNELCRQELGLVCRWGMSLCCIMAGSCCGSLGTTSKDAVKLLQA